MVGMIMISDPHYTITANLLVLPAFVLPNLLQLQNLLTHLKAYVY